ncbi:MAG: glycosyltransferase family 2 protein [Candidatus Delongbacteria bacterium]|jgi:glycosyltransferase involved in cell wall biosynthesis|nr:glycosyltransferase family 2 protein [Candidatus Delongbacteria bacterium]
MTRTLIIVPAYNEAGNIQNVVSDIHAHSTDYDILVVNDCSTDNTYELVRTIDKCNAIDLPINLGIGGAVQTGFKYAFENGYDCAVQFDGDGQHNASELENILLPVKNDEADVVIGSRFLNKEPNFRSSFARRKGIFIFKIVNFLMTKQIITDNTSGFRAYNKKAIEFLSLNYPEDYPEPESVVLLGRNGFRIKEISVNMKERKQGNSSIHGLRIPYYMFKVLLSIMMTGMRRKISQKIRVK